MVFICSEVKKLYVSFQGMITSRRRKDVKSRIQISEPFNFERRPVSLPGLTAEEILVLREKAAATRLGIHLELSDPTASSSGSTLMPCSRQQPPPLVSSSVPVHPISIPLSSTTPRTCSSRSSLRSGMSRSGSMAKIPNPVHPNERAATSQGNFSLLLLDDPEIFSPFDADSSAAASTRGRKKEKTAIMPAGRTELPVLRFDHDDEDGGTSAGAVDWDMFELGSPVSPLSPSLAQRGGSPVSGRSVGRK
ncbi:hypothetical protein QBC44DRAFT_145006 [Cladorrhinum sp. PSN332]|nr:hypothetical protein QBC44DRAFT_145006 [Cladorrhinum sp. PSN332]